MKKIQLTGVYLMLIGLCLLGACNDEDENPDMGNNNNNQNTNGNNNNNEEEEEETGKATISVIVRTGYCADYIGVLTVSVDGSEVGQIDACDDTATCGDEGDFAVNAEVEAGQHSVNVESSSYSSSSQFDISAGDCYLIEIE